MRLAISKLIFYVFVFVQIATWPQYVNSETKNNNSNNIVCQQEKIEDFVVIDYNCGIAIYIAMKNLIENGWGDEEYGEILIEGIKKSSNIYKVTFSLRDYLGFGGNEKYPNWDVFVHVGRKKVLYSGFSR